MIFMFHSLLRCTHISIIIYSYLCVYGGYNSIMNTDPTTFDVMAPDNEFVNKYRQALQESYQAAMTNLNNQRSLDQSNIMNQANKAGVMFSNIPQRMKIQYDTNTFMPNQTNLRNTYQTGLDTLRSNAANAANTVKQYQEMIDYYNSLPTGNTTTDNDSSTINSIAEAVAALAKG